MLRLVANIIITIGGLLILARIVSVRPAPPIFFKKNCRNRKYNYPKEWKGTPMDRKGRFVNHEHPFYQNYVDILKWMPGHLYYLLRNYFHRTPVTLHHNNAFLEKQDVMIWLGHASFYLHIEGKRILIDPQFYNSSVYKRHSKMPIDPSYFTSIDYILISHDHADHLDKRSLQLLVKQNKGVTILTGLGMDKIIRRYTGNPKCGIYCADWFEVYPLPAHSPEITFVPTRHYCKRVDTGYNTSLWGGFIIKVKDDKTRTIYYGGDSGKGDHFSMMKAFEPNIAILGIGAYKPSWFMTPNHMSPKEAIEACIQTGADTLLPMHYGTFHLAYEGLEEPVKALKKLPCRVTLNIPVIGDVIPL
ncbi:MBL fold metallo-hydrolase [Aridibaculum aurantiacum]|uniref:MBL fold metallo-hydrolase n=1 Tax=Aridibaculum aurantiacum TaxID=2810307 RepID=UPI001A978231|nr:MBL fold metallo-hydrolase [Aridibaculum aurantiacum]